MNLANQNQVISFFALLFLGIFSWLIYLSIRKSTFRSLSASWNPAFTDSTGTLGRVTFTGNYNLVGKMVFFCVSVQFLDFSALGTGQYQITLPYAARQTFTSRGGALHNPTIDAKYHIAGIVDTLVDPGKTTMKFYYSGSTTDLLWKYNTPAGWTGGASTTTHFDISGFYELSS